MRPETPAEIRERLARLDAMFLVEGAPLDAPVAPEEMARVMARIRQAHAETNGKS